MRVRQVLQKFNKRYVIDINGKFSRMSKYTKTALNMISNQNFLLRREIFQIFKKIKGKKKYSYEYKKLYRILKQIKQNHWRIRQSKITLKKVNLKNMNRIYFRKFSIYRKFRFHYKNLKLKQIKNIYKQVTRKQNKSKLFMSIIERRLDSILVRSSLFQTMYAARHFIQYNHICVNGRIIKKLNYHVNIGDLVGFKKNKMRLKIKKILKRLIRKHKFISISPAYLETDYRLLLTTLIYTPRKEEIKYLFTIKSLITYFVFIWNRFSRRK
uniref:Ribosomal protein S4 n=1 Tax=Heterostelium pallidum TaxID=13642 RepID=Q5ILJ7_HETPA|nr:ribosomal protein S4 [Heterostelium pallidum]AAU00613.1 ribosomal protein S4 [Heterostelium pallidum]